MLQYESGVVGHADDLVAITVCVCARVYVRTHCLSMGSLLTSMLSVVSQPSQHLQCMFNYKLCSDFESLPADSEPFSSCFYHRIIS